MLKSIMLVLSIFSISTLSFAQDIGSQGATGVSDGQFPENSGARFQELDDLDRALNDAMKKSAKAHPKFSSLFSKGQKAIMKDDLKTTEDVLAKLHEMQDLSPYEQSRIYLLEYWYNGKTGNKELEFDAASKLLSIGAGNIDSHAYVEAGMRLLKYQYNNQNTGGAIETLENLRKDPSSGTELMSIVQVVQKLDTIAEQQTDFVQKITVNETGVWKAKLFRPQFYFNGISGEISSLGFDCTNKQTTLNYKADSVMEIPEAWGSCVMKVVAKPNTTFNLVQSPKKAA